MAGVYVELFVAALAFWGWWWSVDGTFHLLCLNVVVVCSVGTLLFNANPLLRFDGYYVLADLVGIPNLQTRANRVVGNFFGRLAFGVEPIPDPHRAVSHRSAGHWALGGYAVAAYAYRWIVAFGVASFVVRTFEPYRLAVIGYALAMLGFLGLVVFPVYSIQKWLRNRWEALRVPSRRAWIGCSSLSVAAAVVLFTPLPARIDLPCIIEPLRRTRIFVRTPGGLTEIGVRDGDRVEPGTLLARLENPELSKRLAALRLRLARETERHALARAEADSAQAIEAAVQAASCRKQIANLEAESAALELRAPPGDGGLASAPPPLRELGRWLPAGYVLCDVVHGRGVRAYAVLDQGESAMIRPGLRAWVKLPGQLGAIAEGRVGEIGARELAEIPAPLANALGGPVPVEAIQEPASQFEATGESARRPTEGFRPVEPVLAAIIPLPDVDARAGSRAVVRIDVGYRSLAWRIKRFCERTFRFRM
jgi:putative peptide zinc metalloprotease protein